MPPKAVRGSSRGAEPSLVSAVTSKENRPIITAIGLFAVSLPWLYRGVPCWRGGDGIVVYRLVWIEG
jgi:hypothetical protein